MKNQTYLMLAISFLMIKFPIPSFGQNEDQADKEKQFKKEEIKRLIYPIFGSIVGPMNNNIIGNFSTLDIANGELSFAGNAVFDNGSILGIKATGKSTDGLLPVFSNSSFNSKVGVDFQYNILFNRKKSLINYTDESKIIYNKALRENKNDLERRLLEIRNNVEELKLREENLKSKKEINEKTKQIKGLKEDLECTLIIQEIEEKAILIKKLELDVALLEQKIKQTENEILNIPQEGVQKNEAKNKADRKDEEAISLVKIRGFSLYWLSFGYGLSNNAFRTVNPTELFEDQVVKKIFLKNEFSFQFNYFKLSPFNNNSIFFATGLNFSIDDNFSTLSKVEIEETKSIGPTQGSRDIIKKYIAYEGEYKSNLNKWTITGEMFYFLFKKNQGALHFFPNYVFSTSIKPYTNLGFGFVYGFQSKKEAKNIINAEAFVDLFDINNKNNSELRLIDRSTIGIRFTLPFNFQTNKE